jgi:hypothetical protein
MSAPLAHIEEKDLYDSKKNPGVSVVEVYLVRRKGGPHIARACESFIPGQDGGCSWAEDHTPLFGLEFVLGSEPDEEILILRITCQKLNKPAALGGDVVDDAVEHQLVASFQRFDIAPRSEQRVNRFKVDNRKAPVR